MSQSKIHQGHKARKRFGQNFLIDEHLISDIAHSIDPQAQDHIIEIGPGLGAITGELLSSGAALTLIELDRDLVQRLENTYEKQLRSGQLNIISSDILKIDLTTMESTHQLQPLPTQKKLIGNLPYNISTPVLFHVLNARDHFQCMTFMLQKEVVERMCAQPKTSAYSALSVILQLECDVELLFEVPPQSFKPPPKVDSAVVQLRPKEPVPLAGKIHGFRTFVHTCFAHRRKTLRNNLKGTLDVSVIEEVGVNPQDRPEHLSLDDYIRLFEAYQNNTNQ